MKALLLFLAIVAAIRGAAAAPQDGSMTVYYEERAPYQMRAGETVEGLTGSPAARAFEAARLKVKWEASSISRQLVILRRNTSASCVIGWFKTRERLQFAKFTKPVYRDGPIVALVRPAFAFNGGHSLHDTLTSPGLRVLLRSGYVYGAYLDALFMQTRPAQVTSPLPNSQMSELLLANRADLMFTTEEEAAQLLRHLGPKAASLQLRRFSDQVPSEPRYIACTGKVPDETIERINAALGTE
jgi:polar amino acid transport system substrate-binding protein